MSANITLRLLGPRHYMQWVRLRRIFWLLRVIDRQSQLARWAARKRLSGPHRAYRNHIRQAEEKLLWIRAESRWLVVLCEFLYTAYGQCTATAPQKGSRRSYGVRRHRHSRKRRR